jgi:hypothetical protein
MSIEQEVEPLIHDSGYPCAAFLIYYQRWQQREPVRLLRRARSRRRQQQEPAVAASGGGEIKTKWLTLLLSRTCKRGSNQASASRRARMGAGLAARPALLPFPRSRKGGGDDCGGGDDSGGGALIVAIRSGPASRNRRARIGAGLAAPPPARQPGLRRRKGGGGDGGGGALTSHRSHPIRPGLPEQTRPYWYGARGGATGPIALPAPSEGRRRRRRRRPHRPGQRRRKGGGDGGGGALIVATRFGPASRNRCARIGPIRRILAVEFVC